MAHRALFAFALALALVSGRAVAGPAATGLERVAIDLGGSTESAQSATGIGYTGTRPHAIDLRFLPPRNSPAFAWLASVVAGGENSRDFRLLGLDYAGRQERVLRLEKAVIVEIEIPGTDANAPHSMRKSFPRIRVQADKLAPRPTASDEHTSSPLHLDPRFFRLKVDGVDSHKVSSISPFTLTPGPGGASVTPVVVRMSAQGGESWLAWANDELVERGAITRRKATLEYFSVMPTAKTKPIFTVELVDAQLTAFEHPQWGDQSMPGPVSFTLKAKTARLK
jgi:hypothetical protein